MFQFIKIQFICDEAGNFFKGIVEDTIKTREERGIVRQDVLHLLVETRKKMEKLNQEEERNNLSGKYANGLSKVI